MELVIKINKLNDIYTLNNADAFLVSNKHFSYRYDESFCINKIRKVNNFCKENNKKLYVLVNKIFKDEELEKLKDFLIKLKKVNVDGIYFADFAVFMICKELNIEDKCVFYHETFLRNSYDILTYHELGIKNIICSKDMNLLDIQKLPKTLKNNLGIICFGYIPLYESERKILDNYIQLNNLNKSLSKSMNLTLKENTRDEKYKVIQQNGTSSIFASDVLCYLDYISQLQEHINTFIIDSLFFDCLFINEVSYIFKNKLDMQTLKELNPNITYSDMFLNKRIGLM